MPAHTYLYKILDAAPPDPLPPALPLTALDRHDGFIHLSTAAQTVTTAVLFFTENRRLWLLQLRAGDLDGETRYPPELGGGCAHFHGSKQGLGAENVERVIVVDREGTWSETLALKHLQD